MKEIDLNKTIFELTEQYPELIDLLKEIGFLGIAVPAVRRTLGRKTTLPEGCQKQKKDLQQVIERLEKAGYTVVGKDNDHNSQS